MSGSPRVLQITLLILSIQSVCHVGSSSATTIDLHCLGEFPNLKREPSREPRGCGSLVWRFARPPSISVHPTRSPTYCVQASSSGVCGTEAGVGFDSPKTPRILQPHPPDLAWSFTPVSIKLSGWQRWKSHRHGYCRTHATPGQLPASVPAVWSHCSRRAT